MTLLKLLLEGATLLLVSRLIFNAFTSYRSKIPAAHWSANFSSAWILWIRYIFKEVSTIDQAHSKLGPVIRLAPHEVSVNCVKGGILTVYAGGFDKHPWYANLFDNFGIPNMFSTSAGKPHSERKRMLSNIYSKSYIQNSGTMTSITKILLFDRLLPKLQSLSKASQPFDIYAVISATTMDFVTAYLFGLSPSSNFLSDDEIRDKFLVNYTSRHSYNYFPQELPGLTNTLKAIGVRLVPTWVDAANESIGSWTLRMCDDADAFVNSEKGLKQKDAADPDIPETFRQLRTAMTKRDGNDNAVKEYQRLAIGSEMLDHLAAGFDTSGITLAFYVHELSKRPGLQRALHKELLTLEQPILIGKGRTDHGLPSAKVLDALPLLQATLQETLRLRSAIPGPQPRVTPTKGCTLGPDQEYFVPGGVRISAQAHSLHRNPEVFDDPETWRPERWLENSPEKLKDMNRWFWAFGSGGRMCVGSNLALYQMKYIIAALYSNWTIEIEDDEGFKQRDLYTAPPESGKLIVKLHTV
ncbi:putative cytochrome P450 monooxygenase [Microthyrium microscopicum]|uniref:Putative cytochrome P450 monooxygenase n=1 Tax=Microthyrium microscopicum TaxID=703497 RepID=A0A6A6USF6_9PEZI|nr:putative cytochrome P450 monooxygenase [Microthyrium microscopicum]